MEPVRIIANTFLIFIGFLMLMGLIMNIAKLRGPFRSSEDWIITGINGFVFFGYIWAILVIES